MEENLVTQKVIGAAIEVHRQIGPGLLESVYQRCLGRELTLRKINFKREVPIGLNYKGLSFDKAFCADFLIENCVIIELKAIASIEDNHKAQLLTYLKWSGCRLGLLINFHSRLLKNGIYRIIN